jgi:cytochrome c-type biogenesis protein CcmH
MEFDAARSDLETALISARTNTESEPAIRRRHGVVASVLIITVPFSAFCLYWALGAQLQIQQIEAAREAQTANAAKMRAMLERLEDHVAAKPGEGKSWHMLGRGYLALGEAAKAADALRRAEGLLNDEPEVLIDLAQALLALHPENADAGDLVGRTLRLQPTHPRALWLGSLLALQSGQHEKARDYLRQLSEQLDPNSANGRMVRAQIDVLEKNGDRADAAEQPATDAAPQGAYADVRIAVRVQLANAVAARAKPDDTVFVFARAEEGPRQPLAVVRLAVSDLPRTVVLDDTRAMTPDSRLSNYSAVVVGARVSRSGSTVAQSGDLEGFVPQIVKPQEANPIPVALTIDKAVP